MILKSFFLKYQFSNFFVCTMLNFYPKYNWFFLLNYTCKQISGAFDPIKMIMYALFVFWALFLLFGSSFGPYDEHYVFIIVIVVVTFLNYILRSWYPTISVLWWFVGSRNQWIIQEYLRYIILYEIVSLIWKYLYFAMIFIPLPMYRINIV